MGEIFKHLTETSGHEVAGYKLTWFVRKRTEEEAPAEDDIVHSRSTSLRTHVRNGPHPDGTAAEVSTETEINWLFNKDEGKKTPADVDVAPNRGGMAEVPTKVEEAETICGKEAAAESPAMAGPDGKEEEAALPKEQTVLSRLKQRVLCQPLLLTAAVAQEYLQQYGEQLLLDQGHDLLSTLAELRRRFLAELRKGTKEGNRGNNMTADPAGESAPMAEAGEGASD